MSAGRDCDLLIVVRFSEANNTTGIAVVNRVLGTETIPLTTVNSQNPAKSQTRAPPPLVPFAPQLELELQKPKLLPHAVRVSSR